MSRSHRRTKLLCLTAALAASTLVAWPGSASGTVLKNLDFQTSGLLSPAGLPWQWANYVPDNGGRTSGITLGSPGVLPAGYVQAARFEPASPVGRPRAQAKLSKDSRPDAGVPLNGPLDAAEGLDRWYLWYTYFPLDFDIPASAPTGAATALQIWHNDSTQSDCNPNIQLHAKRLRPGAGGLDVLVKVQGGRHSSQPPTTWTAEGANGNYCYAETYREIDLGPVVRGRWIQWAMHMHWSSHPDQGLTQVWRDGQLVANISGANLYRSTAGAPERGYMEEGIYMPNEADAAARSRSVWDVGMRIASAASDVIPLLSPPPGSVPLPTTPVARRSPAACRRLSSRIRRTRFAGGRVVIAVSRRYDARHRPYVRLVDPHRTLRRARVRLGRTRIGFRHRRAILPRRSFAHASRIRLRIQLVPRRGRPRTLTVTVRARRCR